jgi:hypothetical protein
MAGMGLGGVIEGFVFGCSRNDRAHLWTDLIDQASESQ